MGDLISRQAVIDTLKQNGIIGDNVLGYLIVDEINRIPTAYDVDKVVERLEKWKRQSDDGLIAVGVAIEIVKGAVKE